MHAIFKHKFLIGATTLAVAAFAGGAYAATESGTTSRQAFLNDVAKRLNVTPTQLNAAIRGAFLDRLAAAVKAGTLTQAQANRIEQRIEHGGRVPFFFGSRGFRGGRDLGPGSGPGLGPRGLAPGGPLGAPGPAQAPGLALGHLGGPLAAAAHYLGLTDSQLAIELRSGKSLAQVATARGKSVSGLEQAMSAAMTARLNRAVADGLISKAQEQRLLKRLPTRIDRRVKAPLLRFERPGNASQGAPPQPPGTAPSQSPGNASQSAPPPPPAPPAA